MSLNDRISDIARKGGYFLVSSEQVPGVDLLPHIIQAGIIAVGNDGLAPGLKALQVVDHPGSKEGGAVFQGGFIDDHRGALGLDPLHDPLDGGLAEVIGI